MQTLTPPQTCQVDLVCDKGHKYFLSVLQDTAIGHEYRTMAAFILASIVHNFPLGQANALQGSMVSICLLHINDPNSMLRQWLAICLGNLWQNYDKARWSGVRDLAHEKLYPLLQDPVPDVRAAAVYALGTFISSVTNNKDRTEHANNIDRSIAMTMLTTVGNDMSPVVRMELISALQWMVILFECQFVSVFLQEPTMGIGNLPAAAVASIQLPHHPPLPPHHHHHHHHTHSLERNINIKRVSSSSSIVNMSGSGSLINFHSGTTTLIGFGSIYMKLWQGLIQLCRDPYPDVAQMATKVIDFIVNQAVDLISAKEATKENFGSLVGIAGTSSQSLPPSPNTRTSYLGESPPMHHGLASGGVKQLASTVKASAITSTATTSNDPQYNVHNRTRSRSSTPTSAGGPPPASQSTANRSRRNSKNQGTVDDGGSGGGGDASDDSHNFDGPSISTVTAAVRHQQSPSPLPSTSKNNIIANQMTSSTNSNNGSGGGVADYQQKAIVATAFLHWSVGQFSSAATLKVKRYDCHAPTELERIVRYRRNQDIRRTGREQQLRSATQRLETQFWFGRTQFQPHIVKLHPYEPQIAVAYKNKIMVNDWQRSNIQSYVPQPIQLANKSPPFHSIVGHMVMHGNGGPQSRVTAIEFINAHDKTIILAGYEDGSVRIWRPPPFDAVVKESKLVTAWQAIGDVTRSKYQSTATNIATGSNGGGGASGGGGGASGSTATDLCVVWQQRSETCAIAGDPSYIRCWNVETELKTADIRTGSDSSIVTLTTAPNEILAAGFADGSVRLYDKRLPTADAKIMTFRESSTAILAVCLRDDCARLITGW